MAGMAVLTMHFFLSILGRAFATRMRREGVMRLMARSDISSAATMPYHHQYQQLPRSITFEGQIEDEAYKEYNNDHMCLIGQGDYRGAVATMKLAENGILGGGNNEEEYNF